MYKKFSNRLSGGVANSRHRAPFRHLDAVELHRVGGENRASGVQSEKSRESYGESFLIFFFIPKKLRISFYTNFELNNWKLYESRIKFLDRIISILFYFESIRASFLILTEREKKKNLKKLTIN